MHQHKKICWNLVRFIHLIFGFFFLHVEGLLELGKVCSHIVYKVFSLCAVTRFVHIVCKVSFLCTVTKVCSCTIYKFFFFAWLKGFIHVVCEIYSFHVVTRVYSCSLQGLFSLCQGFFLVWLHGLCVVQKNMVIP